MLIRRHRIFSFHITCEPDVNICGKPWAEIDENAKEILKRIDGLSTSIHECYDNWKVLSKHLYDAYWKSEAVEHSFDLLKNGFKSASAILDHSNDSKRGK